MAVPSLEDLLAGSLNVLPVLARAKKVPRPSWTGKKSRKQQNPHQHHLPGAESDDASNILLLWHEMCQETTESKPGTCTEDKWLEGFQQTSDCGRMWQGGAEEGGSAPSL